MARHAAQLLQKRTLILVATVALLSAFIGAWQIKQRVDNSLAKERSLLEKQNIIPFEQKTYSPINNPAISIWQSYKATRAIEKFNDSVFVATDGGLVEFAPDGKLLHHYTTLDGLPESDLLSLATFNSRLFIGTRTSGLVAFDGTRFEGYRWTDRVAQSIDALLADSGRLLIGTRAGGLIAFDGSQFKELKAGAEDKRILEITFLSRSGIRLFVGTFSDGLWTEESARWSHFTTADGLLSNRVVGVVTGDESLFVASDYGLATSPLTTLTTNTGESGQSRFLTVAAVPSLSSLVHHDGKLVLAKDNSETFGLRAEAGFSNLRRTIPAKWNRATVSNGSRLITLDADLWLLNNDGVYRASESGNSSEIRFSRWAETRPSLTSNLISALSVDSQGRLWAGTFRNGIDVLGPPGTLLAHLESESIREINSLVEDEVSQKMLAASAAGLLSFDTNLRTSEQLAAADGLLSNSILHVTHLSDNRHTDGSTLAFATSKGLSLAVHGKFRGVTTVQGLPSNSLYAVLSQAGKLYVGTLGGLAVVEGGRVTRVFKDTNSRLTTNWVTALCAIGPRVFVGTYGGGVFELTASGELQIFSETGRAVVNPNAMWSDGSRLYAGTLDGTLVFDLNSQRWIRLGSEMPARTVLSITGDEKYVYFGTTAGIARIENRYWSQGA